MSYLLETLGRGLLPDLRAAFDSQIPGAEQDDPDRLRTRAAEAPTSYDLALRAGAACLRQVRLREAVESFQAAERLAPAAAAPWLGLACAADALGQLNEALHCLEQAAQRDTRDPAIAFAIGFCHERASTPEAATAAYQAALERCPELRNAYERLAAMAVRTGDLDAAIQHYEQLAKLDPGDLDVLLTLGNLYLAAQRPVEAIAQYQRALLVEPDAQDGSLASADRLADEGRLQEAIESLERLVRKYPGMAPFYVRLGDLYARAGDDPRAMSAYGQALETQPTFLEATVKLGTQHMRQARYAEAALTFNHAVELNDRLMTAFVGLGMAQHAAGREQECLATLDLAASLEPSSTLLFSETTRLQLKAAGPAEDPAEPNGEDELADILRRHQQAALSQPQHADVHYRYGLLLRQLGRSHEAIAAFRRAIALNPNYAKALVKLGICLQESGDRKDALAAFSGALQLDPRAVDTHYRLGLLFAQRNQFDLAFEQFEETHTNGMSPAAFRAHVALALQNIGMIDRAAATWRAICELTADHDVQLSQRESALRGLEQADGPPRG